MRLISFDQPSFVAIQDAYGIAASLADYRVSPLTSGADAMAIVEIIIQVGSRTFSGRGVSTDVVEGSVRAIVSAMNKAAVAIPQRTPEAQA